MLTENRWKVVMLVAVACVTAEPSRALSIYQKPRSIPMFIPRSYRRKYRRVQFLDDDENSPAVGRGEIDLTEKKYNSKIKFDDSADYEFTSDATEEPLKFEDLGTERFYLPRLQYPKFYQGRFSRPYAPSFGFEPYVQVPFAPPRTGYYSPNSGWKARSPRVVFPYAPDGSNANSVQTNSHGGPANNDNVVFRDQNFGTSDIGAEDQTLQDISSGSGSDAFSERDANDPHRARYNEIKRLQYIIKAYEPKPLNLAKPMFIQTEISKRIYEEYPNVTSELPAFRPISDEQINKINDIIKEITWSSNQGPGYSTNGRKARVLDKPESTFIVTENTNKDRQYEKNCPQGGTCEFFFYCWLVGGLLDGSCGSLLKGCCHRVAKSGILGVQDTNSLEYSSNEGLTYGPVINDESKFLSALCHTVA